MVDKFEKYGLGYRIDGRTIEHFWLRLGIEEVYTESVTFSTDEEAELFYKGLKDYALEGIRPAKPQEGDTTKILLFARHHDYIGYIGGEREEKLLKRKGVIHHHLREGACCSMINHLARHDSDLIWVIENIDTYPRLNEEEPSIRIAERCLPSKRYVIWDRDGSGEYYSFDEEVFSPEEVDWVRV